MHTTETLLKIFNDLKVIELATVLAGPMTGMFFAELGAKVIKVENPLTGGDTTRGWRLPQESNEGISAYYASVNYNKEVVFLNLTLHDDLKVLNELIKSADIVVSNYNDQVAQKLKVSYADCLKLNPNIIYAQLYAYDKHDKRPGYDLIMQAESGFMMMNGYAEGQPAKMPVALIDVLAAHQLKEGILIALYQRAISGRCSKIEVSLYQSAISALANQAANYLMHDHIPKRLGTLHPNIAPYGDIFTTRDMQSIILAIGSDTQWQKLGKTLNLAGEDINIFGKNTARVKNRKSLSKLLQKAIEEYSYEQLQLLLLTNAIPFCKIMAMDEVFRHPLAAEMIIEAETDSGQITRRVSTIAFNLTDADH